MPRMLVSASFQGVKPVSVVIGFLRSPMRTGSMCMGMFHGACKPIHDSTILRAHMCG